MRYYLTYRSWHRFSYRRFMKTIQKTLNDFRKFNVNQPNVKKPKGKGETNYKLKLNNLLDPWPIWSYQNNTFTLYVVYRSNCSTVIHEIYIYMNIYIIWYITKYLELGVHLLLGAHFLNGHMGSEILSQSTEKITCSKAGTI